jgi:hypothetical protein
VRNLQVVADKDNNTLLIIATAAEYSVIEAALRKLDVPQRQVVMEVTIAEVTLTDDIQFGVDWLFKGGAPSGRGSGGNINGIISSPSNPAVPPSATTNPAVALAQGFTTSSTTRIFPAASGGVEAARHLRQHEVIANPHVAALDNQKATIKVGDRIPICRRPRRRHHQRGDDNGAVHRYGRAPPGDAAHQQRGTRDARRAGRGQRSRQLGLRRRPGVRAADLDAFGADAHCRSQRPHDGDGRPHQRNARQHVAGDSARLAHSVPGRDCSTPGAEGQPHRARAVHHAARRGAEKDIGLVIEDLRKRMEYLDRMFPAKNAPSTMPGFTMTPPLLLSPAP